MMKKSVLTTWTVFAVLGAFMSLTLESEARKFQKGDLDALAEPVRETMMQQVADGVIQEIEREQEEGRVVYEVEFLLEGEEVEIKVAEDGTLLGRQTEDEEDEEEDDDKDEDTMTLEQAPPPVRQAVLEAFGMAASPSIERESEHGRMFYEAERQVEGREHAILITPEGVVVVEERQIGSDELPYAVLSAIEQRFPASSIAEVEEVKTLSYEIELMVDGEEKEIRMDPEGRVLSVDDDDENEEEDDD